MKGLSDDAIQQLDAAWRPQTVDSYAAKTNDFATWCDSNNIDPKTASTAAVINWVVSLQPRIIPSSQMGYLNAVTSVRSQLGVVEDDQLLRTFRRSLRASGAIADGPREVPPLDRLFAELRRLGDAPPERRLEARAKALVLCKLASLARSFDMQHWLSASVRIDENCMRVTAERTKGRNKRHEYRIVRCINVPSLCPVAAFERYWALYNKDGMQPDKYVWCAIVKRKKGGYHSITADSIARVVSDVIKSAGYEADELRPHGLRNAGASIARRHGATLEAVKAHGGWRSWETMLQHYMHPGDFARQVAEAIYEDFPEEGAEDEASSDEGIIG